MLNPESLVHQLVVKILISLVLLWSIASTLIIGFDQIMIQHVELLGSGFVESVWKSRIPFIIEIILLIAVWVIPFGKKFNVFLISIAALSLLQFLVLPNVQEGYGLLQFSIISENQGFMQAYPSGWMTFNMYLLLFVSLFLSSRVKESKVHLNWKIGLFSGLVILPLMLMIQPVEIEKSRASKVHKPNISKAQWDPFVEGLSDTIEGIDETNVLLVSVKATCSHCNDVARRIGAVSNRGGANQSKVKVVFMFAENESDLAAFRKRNKIENHRFVNLSKHRKMNMTGVEMPSIYLLEKGKLVQHWIGGEFNYYELDRFFINEN